jgi:small conductance mechanosensitive channel
MILELGVGIAYDCDPEQAVTVISAGLKGVEGISEAREPQVGIDGFGDSSIDIAIRLWARTETYYDTKYRVNSIIHRVLAENNIEIPFPQRDVHLISQESQHSDT